MLNSNRSSRTIAAVLLVCCTEALLGCTTWKTQGGDPGTVVAPRPAPVSQKTYSVPSGLVSSASAQPTAAAKSDTLNRIRVITTSGSEVELRNPWVSSDTLYGKPGKDGPVTAFPLDEISSIQVRAVSADKTLGLIGLVGVGLVLGSAVALSQMCVMC